MSVVPKNILDKLEFCENRVTTWTANSVPMGSSAPTITAWAALVVAARAAYDDRQAKAQAAKDATTDLNVAIHAMQDATAAVIQQVRAKAALSGDSIFALASLPVPAIPSPRPAPGKPTDLVVTLNETGVLGLAWSCPNPEGTSGTMYQVWRQVDGGAQTYLGGSGDRKFEDATLPAGSSVVKYLIQAVRSTSIGVVATFNVQFGVTDSGMAMVKSVTEGKPAKMAA